MPGVMATMVESVESGWSQGADDQTHDDQTHDVVRWLVRWLVIVCLMRYRRYPDPDPDEMALTHL
jgi:hypothetical protein